MDHTHLSKKLLMFLNKQQVTGSVHFSPLVLRQIDDSSISIIGEKLL